MRNKQGLRKGDVKNHLKFQLVCLICN